MDDAGLNGCGCMRSQVVVHAHTHGGVDRRRTLQKYIQYTEARLGDFFFRFHYNDFTG